VFEKLSGGLENFLGAWKSFSDQKFTGSGSDMNSAKPGSRYKFRKMPRNVSRSGFW
jgi:hypothetical protein